MKVRLAVIAALVLAASVAVGQGWVERPWLGVMLQPGTAGAKVKVVPGTPADDAGLVDGDEIVAIEDARTRTANDVVDLVGAYRIGDEVVLKVQRGEKTIELTATLGRKPDTSNVARKLIVDRPALDFDLEVLDGEGSGKFADYGGKVVVLEFFTSWCKYCPLMHKKLAALQTKYKDDLVVVGIGSDTKQKLVDYLDPDYEPKVTKAKVKDPRTGVAVERVIHKEPHYGPLGYTALHDDGDKLKRDYLVSTFPTIIVIDRDGFVRDVTVGASTVVARKLATAVKRLIKE